MIDKEKAEEFFLGHLNKFISSHRVRDYLRFLVELKILSETDGKFAIDINPKPTTDAHKLQVLADRARRFLAELLDVPPADVPEELQTKSVSILKEGKLPTLDQVSDKVGVSTNREKETFRWAIYMLLDERKATLSLRHSPVLVGITP
jgi:hypothetical protein